MRIPDLYVFAKTFLIALIGTEIFRSAYYLGGSYEKTLAGISLCFVAMGVLTVALLCTIYVFKRGAHTIAIQMLQSFRIDLLMTFGVGILVNHLLLPWLTNFHSVLSNANPYWSPALLVLFCAIFSSQFIRHVSSGRNRKYLQRYVVGDNEIVSDKDDMLNRGAQAKLFAETVLNVDVGLRTVYGIDGPWGSGKTSFINLAERYWREDDRVIVCRFEPLRYAADPDITARLMRDVSSAIRQKVFAPEFSPAASRYSRLVKGKADISFLGFRISLEPSAEKVDDLLDDIDDVLKRVNRRVIIVIDDLDRLDPGAVNNLLFATRKTFRLSQAIYILCYDIEVLAGCKVEGYKARDFLEAVS